MLEELAAAAAVAVVVVVVVVTRRLWSQVLEVGLLESRARTLFAS